MKAHVKSEFEFMIPPSDKIDEIIHLNIQIQFHLVIFGQVNLTYVRISQPGQTKSNNNPEFHYFECTKLLGGGVGKRSRMYQMRKNQLNKALEYHMNKLNLEIVQGCLNLPINMFLKNRKKFSQMSKFSTFFLTSRQTS